MAKSSLYKSRVSALKKAGINIVRHKDPSPGQKNYAYSLWRKFFASGDIITRKLSKKQLTYFKQTDFPIYKGRVVIPKLGADKVKIIARDAIPNIKRDYGIEKIDREIVLPNGARIDTEIIEAFNNKKPNEHIFVGTDHNTFRTRFARLEDFVKYNTNFHTRWNKNEKEMADLFAHVHVTEIVPPDPVGDFAVFQQSNKNVIASMDTAMPGYRIVFGPASYAECRQYVISIGADLESKNKRNRRRRRGN